MKGVNLEGGISRSAVRNEKMAEGLDKKCRLKDSSLVAACW